MAAMGAGFGGEGDQSGETSEEGEEGLLVVEEVPEKDAHDVGDVEGAHDDAAIADLANAFEDLGVAVSAAEAQPGPRGPSDADVDLPIDSYAQQIISTVQGNRVTIIHGETGCGKSSRLPVLLERAFTAGRLPNRPKAMIGQPRRLAARLLYERMATNLEVGPYMGYRLGHGVRKETRRTRYWYCTVGYLVRLLAHHPEAFASHTHLVIDEVHERSVENDVLTLLARRLHATHPSIRIVLMSATIAGEQFADYFAEAGQPRPPVLFVGARRFPVHALFLEDYGADPTLGRPAQEAATALMHVQEPARAPNPRTVEMQHEVAKALAVLCSRPGSSALVFVSGLSDIESMSERFEAINQRPPHTRCFCYFHVIPVHSEIPHEEQLALLSSTKTDADGSHVARVIVATNAVESSVRSARRGGRREEGRWGRGGGPAP